MTFWVLGLPNKKHEEIIYTKKRKENIPVMGWLGWGEGI